MKKPILVTGAHRSGTSWVGEILSAAPGVILAAEPFNPIVHKQHPFKYWFECITEKTELKKQQEVLDYIGAICGIPPLILLRKIKGVRNIKNAFSLLKEFNKKFFNRALLKDPIALMSAEWIYQQFKADVVICIRHPAAFIASLKVKNWKFDFNNFLLQEELMRKYFINYKIEIELYSKTSYNIIHQGILLWNCLYSIIYNFKNQYRNKWHFIKHEDLSLKPQDEFKMLYKNLNLQYTDKVNQLIHETTESTNISELKRNSAENIFAWKNRLTAEEIVLIKKGTQDVWPLFYNESDW